jgi:ABC-type dipeptide/oligopeptide/nickel transport system ATPase subunit
LRDISFTLDRGRILAVAGCSGSGKTTLARCLARFETPDAGQILLDGRAIETLPRTAVQLIIQQPAASLNPRFTAADVVAEPLVIGRVPRALRRDRVAEAMAAVGLNPLSASRHALEFSGGERQRLAIARALVASPQLLILDESLASLDLSVQAQIANLLLDLRERRGITCILVSHDLANAARIADEIAVMDSGAIVEHAPAAQLLAVPVHPAARELVEANLALSGPA